MSLSERPPLPPPPSREFQYDEDPLEEDDRTFTTVRELNKGLGGNVMQWFARPDFLKEKSTSAVMLVVAVLVAAIAYKSWNGKLQSSQGGLRAKTHSWLSVLFVGVVGYVAIQTFNKHRRPR